MTKTLLFSLALLTTASAQNFSIRYWGTADPFIPTNWPRVVQPIGTNTTSPGADAVMTQAQLEALKASLQSQYDTLQSNKTVQAQAKLDANLARIVALFNQIPAARAQAQTLATNTGTMTTAQLTTALRQTAGVIDGILEELQRLGPVLKQIYKPEEDQ